MYKFIGNRDIWTVYATFTKTVVATPTCLISECTWRTGVGDSGLFSPTTAMCINQDVVWMGASDPKLISPTAVLSTDTEPTERGGVDVYISNFPENCKSSSS